MTTLVVGGGLAGLAAARELLSRGQDVLILEASDRPGGRLKTDVVEGFRLDHGFQVVFDAYPAFREQLDLGKLDLRAFEKGTLLWDGGSMREVHDEKPVMMAVNAYLPIGDKLRVLRWNLEVKGMSLDQIEAMPDRSAEQHLRAYGFSEKFLDRFARPFFGGIFLDRSLQVSVRQFAFVWKMLSEGRTTIPAKGIAEIALQLAEGLPIRTGAVVNELLRDGDRVTGVRLESGEELTADGVVVATESDTAARLTGLDLPTAHVGCTCFYFDADAAPVSRPILVLNASGRGVIQEVVPMTEVSRGLAPAGRHLVSVTVLGWHPDGHESAAQAIKEEASVWFPGKGAQNWRFLRAYPVRYAQMAQPAGIWERRPASFSGVPGLWLAGEFNVNSSIHGALKAGKDCAVAIAEAQS